jgi:hypothetical protein
VLDLPVQWRFTYRSTFVGIASMIYARHICEEVSAIGGINEIRRLTSFGHSDSESELQDPLIQPKVHAAGRDDFFSSFRAQGEPYVCG